MTLNMTTRKKFSILCLLYLCKEKNQLLLLLEQDHLFGKNHIYKLTVYNLQMASLLTLFLDMVYLLLEKILIETSPLKMVKAQILY